MSRPSTVIRNHVALTFMPAFMAIFERKNKDPGYRAITTTLMTGTGANLWTSKPSILISHFDLWLDQLLRFPEKNWTIQSQLTIIETNKLAATRIERAGRLS